MMLITTDLKYQESAASVWVASSGPAASPTCPPGAAESSDCSVAADPAEVSD